jgi:hypothetical protein
VKSTSRGPNGVARGVAHAEHRPPVLRALAAQLEVVLRPDAHARGDGQVEPRVRGEREQRVGGPEERQRRVAARLERVGHAHVARGVDRDRAAERVGEPAPGPARHRGRGAVVGRNALGGCRLRPELAVVGQRDGAAAGDVDRARGHGGEALVVAAGVGGGHVGRAVVGRDGTRGRDARELVVGPQPVAAGEDEARELAAERGRDLHARAAGAQGHEVGRVGGGAGGGRGGIGHAAGVRTSRAVRRSARGPGRPR